MNELLQRHGCSNVFTIPEGLKELMADISREVLRDQPPKIFEYIANYLSVLMVTREHGILAVKILDDLCDCRASVSEHLMQTGMDKEEADMLSQIIKEEIEGFVPEAGKEAVKESQILKKVLARTSLDELKAAQVCQVARNAYRDYWYRKKLMEKHIQVRPNEPWEAAAQRTLEIYKTTKPSYSELTRATQKIQAAYRGYYVRRNLQQRQGKKRARPKVELPGPPLDVAGSREIDLGPVINVQVRDEDTTGEFDQVTGQALHLSYDPMKTITHVAEEMLPVELKAKSDTVRKSVVPTKSVTGTPSATSKSAVTGVEEPALEDAPSEVPFTDLAPILGKRRSLFSEPSADPSRVISKPTSITSVHKISFAEMEQHEQILEVQERQLVEAPVSEGAEVPEAVEEAPKADEAEAPPGEAPGEAEVPPAEAAIPEELPPPEPAPAAGPEEAPEVPEELPPEPAPEAYDSAPEADDSAAATDSAPLPSAASSAPVTDVDTEGEEEGE